MSKFSCHDLVSARLSSVENAGDDDPADVMLLTLLTSARDQHLKNAAWHERQATKCEDEIEAVAVRFKVEAGVGELDRLEGDF